MFFEGLYSLASTLSRIHPFWIILCFLSFLPVAAALGKEQPFPDIPFTIFSKFILENFDSQITLSAALLLLFTMTENIELLNLHARQRSAGVNPRLGTSWIKALAKAVLKRVDVDEIILLLESLRGTKEKPVPLETQITGLSPKLDALAALLQLLPEMSFQRTSLTSSYCACVYYLSPE